MSDGIFVVFFFFFFFWQWNKVSFDTGIGRETEKGREVAPTTSEATKLARISVR